MHDVHVKHFKVDSGACGNLIPLSLYLDLFPISSVRDDVLVYASDYDVFKSNVVSFLDHCVEHDLHLNLDKIRINVDSVPFFGQTLTKNGLMMDENKWKVIQD